jgi:predicted secreted protein
MGIPTAVAVYLVIWWTCLFAILPIGARSHWEEGVDTPGGGDPSAPVNPNLKRKFITTTWVSAIAFAVLWLVVRFHLIGLPEIPGVG